MLFDIEHDNYIIVKCSRNQKHHHPKKASLKILINTDYN